MANNLGNTSRVRQDLRYNYAVIYTDWNADAEFEQDARYGKNFTESNTAANYSSVMTIGHKLSVPDDITHHVPPAYVKATLQNRN